MNKGKHFENFLELVRERRSVRGYTDERVEEATLQYVLECGRLAPSAVNRQPWRIYVVGPDNEAVRTALQECYNRDWFKTAPYILVCSILHDESWKRASDGKDHGDIDIAILTEHLCLAAAEKGLGTCWVCNFDAVRCHEVLHMAETEEAAVMIPLGYPDATPAKPIERKEMREVRVEVRG